MQTLEGKTVILAVTGSIAAVEDIKLARALRRKGAAVRSVMSSAACGIIHPDALTYACDYPAITKISGMIEHVKFCGIGGSADVLLIAPATANTICKIAAGIDDTPVTTFATTAIGRNMPVVIAPAMHESMYCHPAVIESINKLKSRGIVFVSPFISENKAKFAS
ncbi:MAG: flavoprotein, partial [Methanomicrobium sp.]|nr:flavoprotein [Methanomicrobium sp.]